MIYPTQRAVLLVAGAAPVALLIGVFVPRFWYMGLAWIGVLFVLMLIDSAMSPGGRSATIDVEAPRTASIGVPFSATVSATLPKGAPETIQLSVGTDSKLHVDANRSTLSLKEGFGRATQSLRAARRGRAFIETVWLRWCGPLGLVWRQVLFSPKREILIVPDIQPVRTNSESFLRDAMQGLLARLETGVGAEFQALAEYQQGMDRRAIDWKHSARHATLVAREYRTESNNTIVFALDTGRMMCEPVAGVPRIDRAITAALLTAYIALKVGDRVSLFAFDSKPRLSSGSVSNPRSFALLQSLAGRLDYSSEETNYTLALSTLATRLDRRSLIVMLTEIADPTSAELMVQAISRLLSRHLLLFIVLRDSELEDIAGAEPQEVEDVTRAVTAAALLRERQVVIARLRQLGVYVIEIRHEQVSHALVQAYFDLKKRNLL